MTLTDAEVITASVHEPSVFGVIFERHGPMILRYLARRVGAHVAEDIGAEAFRVAFERRGEFESSRDSALPWLYGIATNLLSRHRRSEARRLRATGRLMGRRTAVDEPFDRVVDRIDAQELWLRVASAVAALPDDERDAVVLFAWEELSYADIAHALAIPVGTVRSRLNRARSRLRELIGLSGEER